MIHHRILWHHLIEVASPLVRKGLVIVIVSVCFLHCHLMHVSLYQASAMHVHHA